MREQARVFDMAEPFPDHLGFVVNDVARAFTAAYACRMSSLGLTRPQARAIAYVRRFPGVTQVELSEYLGVGRMAMTGLLDRMESKGLVERKDDPSDRRVKRVYLTKAAADLRPEMESSAGELHAGAVAGVSARDLGNTLKTLRRILHNLEGMVQEATSEERD
jgi:DNA-binding MarR family transcriptional regulator